MDINNVTAHRFMPFVGQTYIVEDVDHMCVCVFEEWNNGCEVTCAA